ncbi:MAG: hypothetical protein ACFFER_17130 [Candidatus Thorarchaeota archaeon]
MKESEIEGTQLENKVRSITVRVNAKENETLEELYVRLDEICENINDAEAAKERDAWTQDLLPQIEEAKLRVKHLFGLVDKKKRSEIGLTGDYQMVILSLLKNFDQCMGASAIAKEWNINSGRVSRVFTASRKKFEKYRTHFEKCKVSGYRFTKEGLTYALDAGLSEILGEREESD